MSKLRIPGHAPITVLATLAGLAGGCAVRHAPPPLPANIQRTPEQSWADVLERHVRDRGQIAFAELAEDPESLHHYVAAIAARNRRTTPKVFGSREATLAHYINAYNALAMYNVIYSGTQPRNLLGFFVLQHFNVGGRYTSLYDFENKVIRPLGEPRVHFALNCMVRSCPRLPREPFRPDALEQQLDAAAREFFNDPRHVRVDHQENAVYVSRILKFYKEDFLAAAPTLINYINRYRAHAIPQGYKLKYLAYDWTLNSATAPRSDD